MAKRFKTKFIPPTPQEVEEYAANLDFPIDGEEFVSSYDSKGWAIGNTPVYDWQALVKKWKINWLKRTGRHKIKIPTLVKGKTAKELIDEIEQNRIATGKPKPVKMSITFDDLKEIAK